MADRPKIGSEIDVANKLSRKKIAQTLRSDQAQAHSFFSRGIGCSGSSQKSPESHPKLCLSPHVAAAISDVLGPGTSHYPHFIFSFFANLNDPTTFCTNKYINIDGIKN